MQITTQDNEVQWREPTVSLSTSLGRECFRSATWQDGDTTTKVTAIAFVTGIRARRHDDGSWTLVEELTRFNVLREDEFVQHIERAFFIWDRHRPAEDGSIIQETALDKSDEIGLYYSASLEDAEKQCEIFIANLDFETNFDPAAWK